MKELSQLSKRPGIQRDPLVTDARVSRRVYLDPGIFELEMDHIFGRTWVYVGHESEVGNPGDFKRVTIGTQPALVTRDENGVVHVLMNRCMHRAATVCQPERGNALRFRCGYHGWTYDSRGELVGLPYAGGYGPGFDRSRFHLATAARLESYRGLLFASLNAEVEPLADYLAGAKRFIDAFMDLSPEGEVTVRSGSHKYGYDGNWKFQLENGVDGYHPNFAHQSFFEMQNEAIRPTLFGMFSEAGACTSRDLGNGHSLIDMSTVDSGRRQLSRSVLTGNSGGEYLRRLIERYGPERTDEIARASAVNLVIFPNLLIIGVQLRTVVPVRVDRTEVYLNPALLKGVPDEVNEARLRAHESFYGAAGGGAPDDLEMFARCTEGLRVKGVEWLEFSRGLDREIIENGERVGHITDEVPQRALYRQWRQLMHSTLRAVRSGS
ncbi:MAG: Rieske 2Fe-2S domain-containing protein [Candidatus Binataceae bacterium]|nr:Rieske 2Fe-2S domain-containing protein [Candidatus Binataceae bacterium]